MNLIKTVINKQIYENRIKSAEYTNPKLVSKNGKFNIYQITTKNNQNINVAVIN